MLRQALVDHYRCPQAVGDCVFAGNLSTNVRLSLFSDDVKCLVPCGPELPILTGALCDRSHDARNQGQEQPGPSASGLEELIHTLRYERYVNHAGGSRLKLAMGSVIRDAYYDLRPFLPVGIRKHIQRVYLSKRRERTFPRWPVDFSAEMLLERLLSVGLTTQGLNSTPFIWFWPKGASACAIVTHDVETAAGRDFCSRLMDIDDEYGVKASFQIVPEQRYSVSGSFLKMIRQRDFEVNVHDLNHDGRLYSSEAEFVRRVKLINEYGRRYQALGFRSALLHRNPDWFHALDFNYDMSIPNVAHMDPQAGGCCTVFPYFIGDILEIPVTTTQDYTLFHILRQDALELWKTQMDLILRRNGLVSCIVHPDYIRPGEHLHQQIYRNLLACLAELRSSANLWIALPREVDQWWRARSQMQLIQNGPCWRIEGPQQEQACVAYAHAENGNITYHLETPARNAPLTRRGEGVHASDAAG